MGNTANATSKPKWVEVLESAEQVLSLVEQADPDERDALIRLAGALVDISDRYKGTPS